MANGNITVDLSTQAAQAEIERLRAENAALKRDLQYARDGLTKGRSRMREDNERLAREAYTWSKAAETYAKQAQRTPLDPLDVEELWDKANADDAADEVHHAFARLLERAHGIGFEHG